MVFLHHFQQYFSYIVADSFIGGENQGALYRFAEKNEKKS